MGQQIMMSLLYCILKNSSREFTHRVKSVSMAKFTSEEVNALQGGGNERAKEVYFKEWDPHRHSLPDSSNIRRLRDFIKHVYVDRRYTGEKSTDMPPRMKMGNQEDLRDNRDTYRGGSRTPTYEDTFERRFTERSFSSRQNDDRKYKYNYEERRNPGYVQEIHHGSRRNPVRFEVVDDRIRDDKFGSGRRFEVRGFPDGETKPNRHKSLDMSSLPVVRSVRDILGEDVPPLRVNGSPKANGGGVTHGSAVLQRTASSNSLGSNNVNSVELKTETLGSLIDFDVDPEPPHVAAVSPAQPTNAPGQSVTQSTTSPSVDGDNWASLDFSTQGKVSPIQDPSKANTLESVFFQLSAPATAPVGNMSMLPAASEFSPSFGGPPNNQPSNISLAQNAQGILATTTGQPSQDASQHSLFTATDSQSGAPKLIPSIGGAPSNQARHILWLVLDFYLIPVFSCSSLYCCFSRESSQLWNLSQGPLTSQSGQPASKPIQETSIGFALNPASVEAKSSERKALPEDLFTATYSSVPVTVPSWQAGPSFSPVPFGMQYPTAVPAGSSPHPSKSVNPFDLNSESTPVHAPMFPSMASLRGALPQMADPPGLLRTSSLGTPSSQWMVPQSSSYGSAVQSPSYASTVPTSAYMGQQITNNMSALGHQGTGYSGAEDVIFGTLNKDQQLLGIYSQPATPNYFTSLGGNPFG
ncbi:Arf GTPase activating protein [Macleaya cordata]|uniref:Arf GTPase activating protein n=1 Tax=Macleaya cordata TaxID=56857 RepID=A0A200QTV9_MACCD|nr:Arf GTPase activating protein [Macleaya cordata]